MGPGYCWYCKYTNDCSKELIENGKKPFYYKLQNKIQEITGVKLHESFNKPIEEICLINSFQTECINDYIKCYYQLKADFGEESFNKRLKDLEKECPIQYTYLKSLLDRDKC